MNNYSINSRSFSKADSIWSLFLPFAFLLVQYGYGLGNIMLTYCILFAGYCVLRYSKFPIFRPLSIYTIWYVLVLLGTVFIFGRSSNLGYWFRLIQILISGYCVTIIAKHLDREALYRCWKVVGLIVCAVVFYQFFQTFFLHQSVLPIRILPVRSEELMRNENWTTLSPRPVAFFTEPAMVVAYLVPVLLFALQKKEWLIAVVVSIAILVSGSTSGVIALVIMWGFSIFSNSFSRTNKFFLLFVLLVGILLFLNLPYFSGSLEKINFELSGDSSNMNVRTQRGWLVYSFLDIRSQLFGISDYDISAFIYGISKSSEFTWQVGYEENYYLNTAQRILIQTGLFGAIIYVWMLVRLWLSTNKSVKPYLAVVIVSMFFASNFYVSGMFVMQFIIILSYLTRVEAPTVAFSRKKLSLYYGKKFNS